MPPHRCDLLAVVLHARRGQHGRQGTHHTWGLSNSSTLRMLLACLLTGRLLHALAVAGLLHGRHMRRALLLLVLLCLCMPLALLSCMHSSGSRCCPAVSGVRHSRPHGRPLAACGCLQRWANGS
jgi:hypothetical protein